MELNTPLAAKRVPISADLLNPGDYVFVAARKPLITEEERLIEPPKGRVRRFFWILFGTKSYTTQTRLPMWPEIDTVIVNCPVCNGACATTRNHKILSIEPLTLEIPLTCPYCKTNTFTIEEGNITWANGSVFKPYTKSA
jgi:hypothetical protein